MISGPNIYGFTLLRNGVKYDYCFEESLDSLSGVTQKVYLALGKGEDKTEEICHDKNFLHILPTVWDERLRDGGLILSQQTNLALDALKKDKTTESNAWGIYLQCDEVFHENDYELIQRDIKQAEESGCDVMTFRYLHFWQNHHDIAINKKWYPQEIRALKLNSSIESWGDAQSFRNFNKVYHSDARIYHYGHVREEDKYKSKKSDILKLYHKDEKLKKYKKREKRFDDQTETLKFFGAHPLIMRARIEAFGEVFLPKVKESISIVGKEEEISHKLRDSILADNINFYPSLRKVPTTARREAVILNPTFIQKIIGKKEIPIKMRSSFAHPWSDDFRNILKLSQNNIGVNL